MGLFIIWSSSVHHLFIICSSSVHHQFIISSISVLHQLFISSSSVLHQFFIRSLSVLHQLFLVVFGSLWQSVAACGSYFPTLAKKQCNNVRAEGAKTDVWHPTIDARLSLLHLFQSLLCSWIVFSSVWYQQYSGAVLPPSVMVLYFVLVCV